jgi:hypothetical protein
MTEREIDYTKFMTKELCLERHQALAAAVDKFIENQEKREKSQNGKINAINNKILATLVFSCATLISLCIYFGSQLIGG